MKLMQHQLDAIDNLDNGKILWGGVGTGKTATALGYYIEKEAPRDIYVITTAKKRDSLDWQGEAARFGIATDRASKYCGKLTIDSWNNIGRYTDIEDAFFIFDEQRVVGSGVWVKSFIKIARNNRWILLSATPGDTWMDYIPVFVANGLYRNATEFKREHVVYAPFSKFPKVLRYTQERTLEKYRNMLLVEMPYISHTNRIIEDIPVEHDVALMRDTVVGRWHPYEDRPIRDISELFFVMRKIVNSDPSRLETIRLLIKQHPRLIIFYSFNYELEILRKLANETNVGEWNGHRKNPIPDTECWVYLVQYVAGAEGWNCTSTDAMAFYSLSYSYKNFLQAQGRIDRLNTSFVDLHYFVLVSDSIIDQAVRESLKNKRLFNEKVWAKNML